MSSLQQRYFEVIERIERACKKVGRSNSQIQLVAVSKGQAVNLMQELLQLAQAAGHTLIFGENYIQEWKAKRRTLSGKYSADLIGPLQSNKAKDAVLLFDRIQSVHSPNLLEVLQKACLKADCMKDVFLQVNISRDPAKHGFLPEEIASIVGNFAKFPNLRLQGLMTITKLYSNSLDARQDFKNMRDLYIQVREKYLSTSNSFHLSMGMSADFELAIEEGATIVRVGTAIFGER